jgi:murein DD-endopeptidase MepM/ murein hydrolase activator NlpD
VAPVDRPVRDPFRLPAGQYGPGNRGLEYDTVTGDPVRAIGAGRVVFAGPVAGRLVLSVDHPDGRRSSLVGLASLRVAVGDLVARGTTVGAAASGLHLGLREGDRYVDPAPFLSSIRRRAVLVAVEPAPP